MSFPLILGGIGLVVIGIVIGAVMVVLADRSAGPRW